MGIDTDIMAPAHWEAALAALDWQVELGVSDWVVDEPLDRYALPDRLTPAAPGRAAAPTPVAQAMDKAEPVAVAQAMAAGAQSLETLREALMSYDFCELKKGARSTVFADGNPKARVLILGEAPGRDEDMEGRPFVGKAGQLLDKMFAAIGLSRSAPDPASALYITNVLPWRPPGDRDPLPEEIAMLRPFLERHVALADPDFIVLMGNTPCKVALNQPSLQRLRGNWAAAWGKPVLPMTHPASLLKTPAAKREAWADLLSLKARL
jgi:uracil-DNA glycosylase family 4